MPRAVADQIPDEEVRRVVVVVVEPAEQLFAELDVAGAPVDDAPASGRRVDGEAVSRRPRHGREVVVPRDVDRAVGAAAGGMRGAGRRQVGEDHGARAVQGRGGDQLGAAVAVEIRDRAGSAEVEVSGSGGRVDARDVSVERADTELRQVHGLRRSEMRTAADQVDGAVVARPEIARLVRADDDVGDAVARDVARPHPDAQAVEGGGADEGREGERRGGRRGEVEVLGERRQPSPRSSAPPDFRRGW